MFDDLNTVESRVARGVKLLNERKPNWLQEINLNTLMMHNVCYCILGQLFAGFGRGEFALFGEEHHGDTSPFYGFDAVHTHWKDENREVLEYGDYADLRAEWVRVIERMRREAV